MDINHSYTGLNSSLTSALTAKRDQLTDLTRQQTTGLKAQTYAGISNRSLTLSFKAKLSENEGYQSTISGIDTRLTLVSNSYENMSTLSSNLAGELDQNTYIPTSNGKTSEQTMAQNSLESYVSALNTEYGGLYIFGGTATDKPPVVSAEKMINGDGAKAGYSEVATERLKADSGSDGMGRLSLSSSGSTVSLSEDGAHVFGMKLESVSTTLSNVAITDGTSSQGGSQPNSLSVDFSGQPTNGEVLTLTMKLADGSSTDITLKAGTKTADDGSTFAIGATTDETAANLQTALQTQLKTAVQTTGTAASAEAAADMFFDTSGGKMPQRVQGSDPYTATSLVDGTSDDTVIWYTGTNDASSPRSDASARVDSDLMVDYGTRANESAIVEQVKELAVVSSLDVSSGDSTGQARYSAMVDRSKTTLQNTTGAKSLQSLETEIAGSQKAAQLAGDRLKVASSTYQTTVDNAMNADDTETATKITSLETQIEASYKASSIVYKLSLADYL